MTWFTNPNVLRRPMMSSKCRILQRGYSTHDSATDPDPHYFSSPTTKPTRASPPANFGVLIVPQQRAWVIERFGKFHSILEPGLHFQIPLVDQVAYVHSLKEEALSIARQMAITKDNVTLTLDGVLYVKISDPYKASYGVEDAIYAVTQLAQTSMRSELGKIR